MSSWQSIGGQQHGQAAHLLNHPPQPPSARHDRRQAQATWTDPQHLRSRRQGYHEAWAARRQEAAAAANSLNRVKAAAELLPHEPQLYALDVDQSEDLAHSVTARICPRQLPYSEKWSVKVSKGLQEVWSLANSDQ